MLPRFTRRLLAIHIAAALCLLAVPASAEPIERVTVGDPGNSADDTTYGAVATSFQIMKYEFTNQQYTDF